MREWLQEIRTNKNLTHDDVATAAKIKRAYYTMIENGNRNPSVDVAKKIASFLGFNWTNFYDYQGNEMTHKTKFDATGTG